MAKTKPAAAGHIQNVRLADALGERYLAYALSTIVSRSLPDVRDGLKPVHRRLLYAMRELKLDPKAGYKKCARVVGDVMGKYHPHGDVAIYDSLVRMSQEFAQRYPLIDGQGNFGNIDGDNAAAMRYTEARLTPVALALLDGLDDDAVDFRDTYDGEEREPVVLPAAFPNLLANGAAGIAVGMATSIPPHNAAELCTALIHLIKNRPNTKNINESQVTFKKLVQMIPGPDFPTGGILVESTEAMIEAYRTGRGGFRLRARWQKEKLGRGQYQIIVTEIPYQVQKSRLIEKTAELLLARKLPLLADIHDESSEDLRLVLEPRNRSVEPQVLMEQMFRQTDLEVRIGLNMNALDAQNTPQVMDLRRVLTAFLEHRYQVLERRSRHRLQKIERRLEILDGMLIAFLNLDRIIQIIRREDEPKPKLMKAFKLTDVQAEAILNMRLRQLRKLEEASIKDEHKALSTERTALKRLLKDKDRKWDAVAGEIADIKERFGPKTELGRRRTEIGKPPAPITVPLEAMVEREPVTIVCSEKGWIRAVKGHLADGADLKYKEGDRGRFELLAQTTDRLIVFATNGRCYTIGCDKLPGGRGHGEPLRLMIDLPDDHDVVNMRIHDAKGRLVVASASGRGFVVAEADIIAQTRNGKQVLNLAAGEEAAACVPVTDGADSVAVLGDNRRLLIIGLDELPVMGRGRGVILQRYREGGLADLKTFETMVGLTWRSGRGERTETDLEFWTGKRGQTGHVVPKGFPRANRFG